MLTNNEMQFVEYWENNRLKEKRIIRQLYVGLPLGLGFAILILVNFLSGWFKRANMTAFSSMSPTVLVVSILLIAGFIAIFYKMHQWDLKEQHYLEIKNKLNKQKS